VTVEVGGLLLALGGLIGYVIAQDRRITRLEERVRSLGQLLMQLPKRKTDRVDD
jgi:hypothetical protein